MSLFRPVLMSKLDRRAGDVRLAAGWCWFDPVSAPPLDLARLTDPRAPIAGLSMDRPLWAALVVPDFEDGRTGLVIVFHHVVADGIAGLAILGELIDEFVVLSYRGRLTVTVVSDLTTCPDLDVLRDAVAAELAIITGGSATRRDPAGPAPDRPLLPAR